MPQIPKLPTSRVQNTPFSAGPQRLRTTSDAFGTTVAATNAANAAGGALREQQSLNAGVQSLAESTQSIFAEEQKRQSNMELLKAKERLNDFELGLTLDGGALSKRGEDASGVTMSVMKELDDLEKQVLEQTSPVTRQAIQEMVLNRKRSVLGSTARHEREQREGVEKILHATGVKQEQDLFASVPVDEEGNALPEVVTRMTGNITSHYREMGRLNGMPKEVVDAQIKEAISAAHISRIERLLGNGQSVRAKKYLSVNGDALTEADEAKVEEHVNNASVAQEAQDFVDSLGNVGLGTAIDAAKKIKDEKLRSEAISKIRLNHSINEERRRVYERQALEQAWTKQGTEGAALTAFERSTMSAAAIAKWEEGHARKLAGLPERTDEKLKSQFSFMSPSQLAELSFEDYWNKYAPSFDAGDRDWAEGLMRSARNAKTPKAHRVGGIMTENNRARSAIYRAIGIDPNTTPAKLTDDQSVQYSQALGQIDADVRAWEEQNKRKIDDNALDEIVKRFEQTRVFDEGYFRDTPTTGAEVDLDDAIVPIASMRLGEADAVKKLGNNNGKVLSEDDVQRAVALRRIIMDTSLPKQRREEAQKRLGTLIGRKK